MAWDQSVCSLWDRGQFRWGQHSVGSYLLGILTSCGGVGTKAINKRRTGILASYIDSHSLMTHILQIIQIYCFLTCILKVSFTFISPHNPPILIYPLSLYNNVIFPLPWEILSFTLHSRYLTSESIQNITPISKT